MKVTLKNSTRLVSVNRKQCEVITGDQSKAGIAVKSTDQ